MLEDCPSGPISRISQPRAVKNSYANSLVEKSKIILYSNYFTHTSITRVSFAHAWIKASIFEKQAERAAAYARQRRCIGRAHYRFLGA